MERIRTLEPLGRHLEAVKDWDLAIACADAGQSLELRSGRALSLARAGQASRAVAAADELTQSKGVPSGTLYDLACVCSVASAAVDGDANLKRQYGARAVELIRRAFSSGFKDVDHMKKDPDLDPLRAREDFKTVLAELDSKKNP